MRSSLALAPTFALALVGTFFFVIPGHVVAQGEQPAERAEQPTTDTAGNYGRYAKAIMKSYDKNNDGMLAEGEMKMMRRAPAKNADSNGDGMVSLDELTNSLAARNGNPKAASKTSTDAMDEIYMRLSDQVLLTSDKNNNGQLDPNEIKDAKWTSPWKKFDANEDGILSRNELFIRYKAMLSKDNRAKRRVGVLGELTPSHGMLGGPLSGNIKVDERMRGGNIGALMSKTYGSLLDSGDPATAVQLLGGIRSEASEVKKESGRVAVQLYLLRFPSDTSADSITTTISSIKEADDIRKAVAKVGTKFGVRYDQAMFTQKYGTQTDVESGAMLSVKTGKVESRGRTTYNVDRVSVGMQSEVLCEKVDGGVSMDVSVKKSDVVQPKEPSEFNDTKIVQWTYKSTLLLESGQPEFVVSSDGDQHWLLVSVASEVK